MKNLQKLGKALMLPVAVLPICGILMGLGYALAPAAMGAAGATEGFLYVLGFFLIKAGGAVIDNMAILFAVGVAVGLADEENGTAALSGLVAWLMFTTLLSVGVVGTIAPDMIANKTNEVAFSKIANPFIGILSGVVGALCYNKFKGTKLPEFLAFFSGKRSVAIVTGVVAIVLSAILLFVWPVIFGALVSVGNFIKSLDVIGVGLYAFLNRLLIPTGLHHALNNVFWFDTIGMGDLTAYWNPTGEIAQNANWSIGMYMAGFFPCMMCGIPGAALAMVVTAKSNKKKATIGIVGAAALCAFLCGVTEPFEFAFMFLAFPLYVVYSLLYGIFAAVTVALGFRAGFMFSAGATDLIFSASLPAAAKTWLIFPMGIAAFVVFFLVFLFAIKTFNLKTPGREDDGEEEAKIELANNDYTAMASVILEGLGGKDNVASIDHCITRLRLEVKDRLLVNEAKIKSSGASGVIRPGKNSVQVIIGPKVQFVYEEFKKLAK
ncbi:MAG TPA: PTS transporter subunit EIIC [Candidatus Faecousia excrementigallinarum]|uniref:PTS transporter subunit EIIC n=1 Tax=Candidatus Faecousia excrementigallinarum TaxID=2840806 RepID=A0A9D0Z3I6_9FIRM|nr:PTS transporter subunit EIIC [Candidatus Faecousia excrementigallinarum]